MTYMVIYKLSLENYFDLHHVITKSILFLLWIMEKYLLRSNYLFFCTNNMSPIKVILPPIRVAIPTAS